MTLVRDCSQIDLHYWQCPRRLIYGCTGRQGIKKGSYFAGLKLTLQEIIRLIFHYFINGASLEETITNAKLGRGTVVAYFHRLKTMTFNVLFIIAFTLAKQGGSLISECITQSQQCHKMGVVLAEGDWDYPRVEADESLFGHHGEGRAIERQVWAFGLYDRGTTEVRVFVVKKRDAAIILPIIKENVQTTSDNQTRIYTDGWAVYKALNGMGYAHRIINHQLGFGSGSMTTNRIEGIWSEIKFLCGFYEGVHGDPAYIQALINYGVWKRSIRKITQEGKVYELIAILRSHYDVQDLYQQEISL
eukprot:TRINITY_DN49556_c0_g1_i7.p1 TRINITY_DN49556_c0_g1~~TRINITY_DN49556_c0_g1_i7.p1  ORF type:complete len:303 (+),score=-2.61 TRINITY_DN49556_c0_g1_i7:440-1348(+)